MLAGATGEACSGAIENVTEDLIAKIPSKLDNNKEVDIQPLLFKWALECKLNGWFLKIKTLLLIFLFELSLINLSSLKKVTNDGAIEFNEAFSLSCLIMQKLLKLYKNETW